MGGKPRHRKTFACGLRTLNTAGTEVLDTFQIGASVNVRSVTLSHLAVAYEAPQVVYGDTKCALLGADGYLEVPYTAAHALVDPNGDKKGGACIWIKTPDIISGFPVLCHGGAGGWLFEVTALAALQITLKTDAANDIIKRLLD